MIICVRQLAIIRRPTRAQRRATSVDFGGFCVRLKAVIPDGRTSVATCMIRAHSISNKKVKYKQSSRTQRARELCLYINSFKSVPYACGKQWRYCDGQSR